MRTTLTIDDDLAAALKRSAQHSGKSFKAIVNEAIRRGLSTGEKPAGRAERFRVLSARRGFLPGVDPLKLNQLVVNVTIGQTLVGLQGGKPVRIWVDADACPNAVKAVVFRAAERLQIRAVLVANQAIRTPPSRVVESRHVAPGFDVADRAIVAQMAAGDLVITADVPLAAEVVEKGGAALNPRGTMYTLENVRDHLQRRDMMDELRSAGAVSGGPAALGRKDVQRFANALDRYLARNHKRHRE